MTFYIPHKADKAVQLMWFAWVHLEAPAFGQRFPTCTKIYPVIRLCKIYKTGSLVNTLIRNISQSSQIQPWKDLKLQIAYFIEAEYLLSSSLNSANGLYYVLNQT
jgi:hypothetical protein